MKTKTIQITIILFFFALSTQAQIGPTPTNQLKQDTLTSKKELEKSYFKSKLSFTNNYNFNGRVSTINTVPFITPYIGYFNKSGFSISSSVFYSIAANENRVELYLFDIGYDIPVTEDFAIGLYANKTNYNKASTLFSSSIKGYAGAYLEYDFDFITFNIENTVLFSSKSDIALAPSLFKEFTFLKDDALSIKPTILANFSTTNFYEDLLRRKRTLQAINTIVIETTVNDKKLQLMDYEFSVPVEYTSNKFTFFAIPTVAFPINPIRTTNTRTVYNPNGTQIGQPTYTDSTQPSELNLKNQFFIEFGLQFKF